MRRRCNTHRRLSRFVHCLKENAGIQQSTMQNAARATERISILLFSIGDFNSERNPRAFERRGPSLLISNLWNDRHAVSKQGKNKHGRCNSKPGGR